MLSRRQFIGSSGAAGMLLGSGAVSCYPGEDDEEVYRGEGSPYLELREKKLNKDPKIFLGYPGNKNTPPEGYFKWREALFKTDIGARSNNNVGDPFRKRGVYSTHYLEAEIIDRFSDRFGFDRGDYWGFISHSGTDSNMHGAYIGRTLLKQKTGVTPKIYYTRQAHYSIQIIRDLLAMEPVEIVATPDGAMDMSDLEAKLKENTDAPALVVATIGTTFTGGIDDIDKIGSLLKDYESYLHLDAALFGAYFQASDFAADLAAETAAGKRYDSIAVSCHKFFGFPMVAGMFVTRKSTFEEYREYFSQVHDPDYIRHVPGTITCSRNTLTGGLFHYYSTREAFKVQQADARRVLKNAAYLHKEMLNHFPELNAQRSDPRSNTVFFRNVDPGVRKKWQLATIKEGLPDSQAHVVVMPHASTHYIDMFLADLDRARKHSQA